MASSDNIHTVRLTVIYTRGQRHMVLPSSEYQQIVVAPEVTSDASDLDLLGKGKGNAICIAPIHE